MVGPRSTGVVLRLAALLLALLALSAQAQVVKTFTAVREGVDSRPLGYPVPLPVASLEPVDGFRDYPSLHARHQQLDLSSSDITGQVVGQTQGYGRPIWAYVIGDADALTVDGEAEPSAFINANIHAREWQAPEVATGIIEYLAAGADDGGMVRFVLDNFHLVIVPVLNVDGLLQTQRFPTQAIVGQDPTDAADWPRDGRMRRKNMRGPDEVLLTFADHLLGVDLNRNFEPYWGPASSGGSRGVPNPVALTYHGTAAGSEAESAAVEAALVLAQRDRLRLGIDLHSYGAVFFAGNTGNAELMAHQGRLVQRLQTSNQDLTRTARFPNGRLYRYAIDPPGAGLGSVAEMLAARFRIPAWTLELEPFDNGSEYGGIGASHDGFILPASEIRRVRDGWAATHALALYHQAGPPYIAEVEISDAVSGELQYRAERIATGNARALLVTRDVALRENANYLATLRFSKPMRYRIGGAVAQFPGQATTLDPLISVGDGAGVVVSDRRWLGDDRRRYRDDSFGFAFATGTGLAGRTLPLRVNAKDMAALDLDARADTPVGFNSGFVRYEDELGQQVGAGGGTDVSNSLAFASAAAPISAALATTTPAEGDDIVVTFNRAAAGPAVSLRARAHHQTTEAEDFGDWTATVSWAAGEGGARRMRLPTRADAQVEGEESAYLVFSAVTGRADLLDAALPVRVRERLRIPDLQSRAGH